MPPPFIAAQTFVPQLGAPPEGLTPTLLESPGIHIAPAIGALQTAAQGQSTQKVLHQVITARTMFLLVGSLLSGVAMGESNWKVVEGFFDTKGPIFRGAPCLLLLEMGILARSRITDLRKVGPFLGAPDQGAPETPSQLPFSPSAARDAEGT